MTRRLARLKWLFDRLRMRRQRPSEQAALVQAIAEARRQHRATRDLERRLRDLVNADLRRRA